MGDDYRLMLCARARANSSGPRIGAVKLKADGTFDSCFGQAGQAFFSVDVSGLMNASWEIGLFADGNIVLAALDTIYKVLNE